MRTPAPEPAEEADLPRTLSAYADRAAMTLPESIRAYFLHGSGQDRTLRANIAALEQIALLPRVLRDLRGGGTATILMGQALAAPLVVAPMAFLGLLHPEGESGVAAAATAQGVGMALSVQAGQPMADVRRAGAGCGWMQLYWQPTRAATMTLADRAARAGFRALVLTLDAPVNGVRDAEIAAGFALPPGMGAVNLGDLPQARFAPLEEGGSLIFDRIAHVLPHWDDIAWFCEHAPLPVILKGVLHPGDATLAVGAGAAGVIVSNHGGRVLDGAPSAISCLPAVAAQVAGAVPVLMDSGIRRGADVFRALALGADAVMIGRPVCHGLAVAGALGASHVLRLLRDELEVTMALTGCATLADITRDHVALPDRFSPF